MEDYDKLSYVKANHKGKTKGCASTKPIGDGGGINVDGGSTVASNDGGITAAVVAAAHHVSLMSASEGQDGSGHGHGGDSAGADGGG